MPQTKHSALPSDSPQKPNPLETSLITEASPDYDEASFINDSMTTLLRDFYEVEELIQNAASNPENSKTATTVERSLHILRAFCQYHANALKDRFPESERSKFISEHLDNLRSRINSIRFLPLSDVLSDFSALKRDSHTLLKEIAPEWDGCVMMQYNPLHSPIPEHIINGVIKLSEELCIDVEDSRPQKGLLRPLTFSEISAILSTSGGRLFVLRSDNELKGYALVQLNASELEEAKRIFVGSSKIADEGNYGWVDSIGVTLGASLKMHRMNVDSYEHFSALIAQSMYQHGLTHIFGEVRVGNLSPNASRKSHLRKGLTSTGIIRNCGNYQYELLYAQTTHFTSALPEATKEQVATPVTGMTAKLPDKDVILSQWEHRNRSTLRPNEICMLNGDANEVSGVIFCYMLSHKLPSSVRLNVLSCSDGLVLQLCDGCIHYTMRQLFPNQDIWTCDNQDDSHRTGSFYATLNSICDLIQKSRREYLIIPELGDFLQAVFK